MGSTAGTVRFTCPPTVSWVRDADRVIVVNEATGQSQVLRGQEAALWSLLCLRYDRARLVEMLAVLLDRPAEDATRELSASLETWLSLGLLVRDEGSDG